MASEASNTQPPLPATTLQPYNLTRAKRAKEKGRALVDSALGLGKDCSEPSPLAAPLLGAADYILGSIRTQDVKRDDHAAPARGRLDRQDADRIRVDKALDQTRFCAGRERTIARDNGGRKRPPICFYHLNLQERRKPG